MRHLIAFLLLSGVPGGLCAEVAMLHPDIAITDLSIEHARDMLVGRITTWPDGKPVVLVLVDDVSSNQVLCKILERDTNRLLRGWKRLVYSGTGAMPVVVGTPEDAARIVAKLPGAFALVPNSMPGSSCRFLSFHAVAP